MAKTISPDMSSYWNGIKKKTFRPTSVEYIHSGHEGCVKMTFISKMVIITSFWHRPWGLIWLQLVRTGITNALHYYFMPHIFISDKCCNKMYKIVLMSLFWISYFTCLAAAAAGCFSPSPPLSSFSHSTPDCVKDSASSMSGHKPHISIFQGCLSFFTVYSY